MQQPQVIIMQPAWQAQYAQPVVPQQTTPWQQPAFAQQFTPQLQQQPQQFAPQYQYVPRPWGDSTTTTTQQQRPASSGRQQTFAAPYGAPPAAGVVQPGWGVAPYGVFPGADYPGSIW
ncbi:MAG: hypothetical protein ABFS22_08650 [Pseudomonadota bacterium]